MTVRTIGQIEHERAVAMRDVNVGAPGAVERADALQAEYDAVTSGAREVVEPADTVAAKPAKKMVAAKPAKKMVASRRK